MGGGYLLDASPACALYFRSPPTVKACLLPTCVVGASHRGVNLTDLKRTRARHVLVSCSVAVRQQSGGVEVGSNDDRERGRSVVLQTDAVERDRVICSKQKKCVCV